MNYANFLMNTIIDNVFTNEHHIIPRSCGGTDEATNIIRLTPAQHAYAHYLWDREHGTDTFRLFANRLGIKDLDNVTYEDCLPYNFIDEQRAQHVREAQIRSWQDEEKSEVRRQKMSEAKIGKVNVCVNTVWVNNGETRKRVSPDNIPEGYKLGQKIKG